MRPVDPNNLIGSAAHQVYLQVSDDLFHFERSGLALAEVEPAKSSNFRLFQIEWVIGLFEELYRNPRFKDMLFQHENENLAALIGYRARLGAQRFPNIEPKLAYLFSDYINTMSADKLSQLKVNGRNSQTL